MKEQAALDLVVVEAVEAAQAAEQPVRVNALVGALVRRFSLGPNEALEVERRVLDQASLAGAAIEFDGRHERRP